MYFFFVKPTETVDARPTFYLFLPVRAQRMCPAVEPMNSGQPGCTPAEKQRHAQLLESGGGLIDAYRHLHPAPENDGRRGGGDGGGTDTEGITWRGTAGNDVAEMGRFYGKVRRGGGGRGGVCVPQLRHG